MNINNYDLIILAFSGGKDSLACLLKILDSGIDKEKILLFHNCVDGNPLSDSWMKWDWECTHGYVKSIAEYFKLKLCWSWRNRGFHGQVMRKNEMPEAICYKFEHSPEIKILKSTKGNKNTRMKFPAKTASLVSRWCSSCLKIDVSRSVITDMFPLKKQNLQKILYISGERREESIARSKYEEFPPHPGNVNPSGRQGGRIITHWRMIIDWKESDVWKIIEKYKIRPHPAYQLGFGRVSCAQCIFLDNDGWASLNKINPERINKIIELEKTLNFTLDNKFSMGEILEKGRDFITEDVKKYIPEAISNWIDKSIIMNDWQLPLGAYNNKSGGPI